MPRIRILIAEPTPSLHDLLDHVSRGLGHYPVDPSAVGGKLACDLVILEPAWPTARRLAERLRLAHPTLPIVCVSKSTSSSWASELGVSAYLTKPFALRELEQSIVDSVTGTEPRSSG